MLCDKYIPAENVNECKVHGRCHSSSQDISDNEGDGCVKSSPPESGEFEVERILGIRHVGGTEVGKARIEMKV